MESLERQTRETPELLQPVECSDDVLYLWEYFCSMNTRRTNNGFGPNPITDEGVESWARRRGVRLQRWEQQALDALEAVYLAAQVKKKP